MSTAFESKHESNGVVHSNGTEPKLALERADTQVHPNRVDYDTLLRIGKDLLIALGQDVTQPSIIDTPRRFANMWREFIEYDTGTLDTTFESISTNQMVVVSGMRVWSVCEHHLLPFWCDIHIGYIAREKVLGLSKFARIAHKHAHKPQIQERLVHDIADEIQTITDSPDVAVMAQGVHLCMVMRGIKTEGTMTSSVMRGMFYDNHSTRQEFLTLVK